MNFNDVKILSENYGLLLERQKRKYVHRKGYKGNEKGSYINKGKTKWDYSSGEATPGNERIVTQIQNKIKENYGANVSRDEIKKFLKTDKSQKVFDKFKNYADAHFGDPDSPRWRGYTYGGFTKAAAAILNPNKKEK